MKQSSCSGMTIIEVLVATLLSSLMLSAVAGLLGALARQERALARKRHAPAWQTQFTQELLWDLRNARRCAVTESGVFLEGLGGRDFGSLRPTGESAEIDYLFVEAAGERWLVRRESHPADRTSHATRVDLVCRGVERLRWGGTVVHRAVTTNAIRPGSERFMSVPERVELELATGNAAEPLFHDVLCVR